MGSKITDFLRDFVVFFSIIFTIIGIILVSIGGLWYGLNDTAKKINFINNLGDWNFYVLVVGFISLGTGIYYLYSFIKNRKFVLEELKTNKRSEFLKKHSEVKNVVRHLPSKYHKMLKDKEKQLKIK